MGSSSPVKICFTSKLKNCFANISPLLETEWANVWKDDKIVKAIHLDYDGKSIYTSWSGGIFKPPQDRYAIEISRKFGDCLGLKEGQEVVATPLNKVSSCSNVTFTFTSQSDWEIAESNSKIIESGLINQVRIIWKGEILPVWIQKNNCFVVTVDEITPKGSCTQINEFTEVKLVPQEKDLPSGNKLVSEEETQGEQDLVEASSTVTSPSSLSDKSTDSDNSSLSQNSTKSLNLSFGRSSHHVRDKYEQTHTPADLTAIHLYGLRAGVVNLIKGVVFGPNSAEVENSAKSQIYPSAFKAPLQEAKIPATVLARRNKSSLTLFSDIPIESYYRVQDLVVLPNDDTSPHNTCGVAQSLPRELLEQPSTVFIHCANLTCTVNRLLNDKVTTHGDVSMSKNYVFIIASIHKMYSVKERTDMNSSSKRSDMGSNDSTPNDEIRESDPVKIFEQKRFESSMNSKQRSVSSGERGSFSSLPTTIVRLVLTNQRNFYGDQDSKNHAFFGEELLSRHIAVSGLLRRQLKLGVKSAVQIKRVFHKPSTLLAVVLNPFGADAKKAKYFSKSEISAAFTNWIMEVTKECPLILASRMLVSFNITPDVKCEFLLSGIGSDSPNSNTRNGQHYFVCEKTLKNANVTVGEVIQPSYYLVLSPYPSKSTNVLDQDLPKCSLMSLGGFDEIYQTCFDFLLHGLSYQPVSQQLCHGRKPSCNTLLIYGSGSTAGGSGKSSLARALCHHLGKHPILAHISVIDCISLRGKRVETIRKSWQRMFSNSAWHQPAVILFDDLDQLISAPSLVQEHGPEANYTQRLAEAFKCLLSNEVEYNSQLVVIATVTSRDSIHPSLLTSHGNHIFNKTVEIPLPGLDQRALMISCMLRKKDISLPSEDIRVIAVKTEGCSPKDLNTLIARSFQTSTMRRNVFKQDLATISLQDFIETLRNFKPASLHGIKLHQGVDLGWKDIGGLEEIKRILMETLEWPAKFPDLYANIPMRLPSGILLYGPPGTGKTLLAGVVARECSLNFISIKGPELLSKYIGASEQAVRDLFHRAQSAKPCILFFDEFDSMAPRRGHDSTGVTDRVVNQLLTQLDGVEGLLGVYILAATSRPDLIDPALLRPGRLDKALYCGMPEEKDRLEILKALSRKLTVYDNVDFEEIARETQNFSGADLKALLCNAQLERIHEMKITASGKSDKPIQNSNILCMPQLQHGPQELHGEENTELKKQVAVLEDNFFKSVYGKADHSPEPTLKLGMIIGQNVIMKALSNMGPSVSPAERIKYAAIYHSFMKSKKSDSPQKAVMQQRATLA